MFVSRANVSDGPENLARRSIPSRNREGKGALSPAGPRPALGAIAAGSTRRSEVRPPALGPAHAVAVGGFCSPLLAARQHHGTTLVLDARRFGEEIRRERSDLDAL